MKWDIGIFEIDDLFINHILFMGQGRGKNLIKI
jgi:hypothetical protein